jgi:hypothetical protein
MKDEPQSDESILQQMGYKQVNKGYTMAMASLSDYQMF